jgi:hypothetical protein
MLPRKKQSMRQPFTWVLVLGFVLCFVSEDLLLPQVIAIFTLQILCVCVCVCVCVPYIPPTASSQVSNSIKFDKTSVLSF